MNRIKEFKETILSHIKANKEIICDVSGLYYYWQTGANGMLSSAALRVIADELDSMNEPYQKSIDEYFSKDEVSDD